MFRYNRKQYDLINSAFREAQVPISLHPSLRHYGTREHDIVWLPLQVYKKRKRITSFSTQYPSPRKILIQLIPTIRIFPSKAIPSSRAKKSRKTYRSNPRRHELFDYSILNSIKRIYTSETARRVQKKGICKSYTNQ